METTSMKIFRDVSRSPLEIKEEKFQTEIATISYFLSPGSPPPPPNNDKKPGKHLGHHQYLPLVTWLEIHCTLLVYHRLRAFSEPVILLNMAKQP